MTQDLILHMNLCPGDTVATTAVVRDLHLAYPGRFRTDFRGTAEELYDNLPYMTDLDDDDPNVRHINMECNAIHQCTQTGKHIIDGFVYGLEKVLNIIIPLTRFSGDVRLTEEEKKVPLPFDWDRDFWILMAGGKTDNTTKWWDPDRYQELVDTFQGCIQFVQCAELSPGHWHEPLKGVIDLRGKTSIRDFVRLMYHAAGVVCPITFAMHLAAAVPTCPGRSKSRPCVVIAGGKESRRWFEYPEHRVLTTNGALPCCDWGGVGRATVIELDPTIHEAISACSRR